MIRISRLLRVFWTMLVRTMLVRRRVGRVPAEQRARYRAARQMEGCRVLCRILGIRVGTEGRRPDTEGMLVVSNHLGVLDPIILASALPVSFVGKAELKHWPFLGWVATSFGMLLVQRERRTTVTDFAQQVRGHLKTGADILVFPEGTTSPDENILRFKTGAFEAVAGTGDHVVLPVYLAVDCVEGERATGAVRKKVVWSDPNLPFTKHAWDVAGLKSVHVTVRIGDVISTERRDRKELAQLAQEAVEALRDRPETIAT